MTEPHVNIPRCRAAILAVGGLVVAAGCGASGRDPDAPAPAVAGTQNAARAYRRVEARWVATTPHRRVALMPELQAYLRAFPDDPTARRARLYVAWLHVESGQLDAAAPIAARDRSLASGAEADLATIVESAVLTRRGRPREALGQLEPLRGKIIDADDRLLFASELVRAALDAKRYGDAVTYMLDFAEHATVLQGEDVKTSISDQLRLVPADALEESLDTLTVPDAAPKTSGSRVAARKWLERTIRSQLVRWALTRKDVPLAKRLLDRMPSSLRLDETRQALRQLAARGTADPRVEGRALGLVLELTDAQARRRSAEVAAGMSRALDFADAAQPAARLMSRDAATPAEVRRALGGLAGDGAAILVVGVTASSAAEASAFAAQSRIPVVLLTPPPEAVAPAGFAFVLGDGISPVMAAVESALGAIPEHDRVVVGPGGSVPCDLPPAVAGSLRFPVAGWKRAGVRAVVLLGDARCSGDVAGEVRTIGLEPTLVLGLESRWASVEGFSRLLAVAAGDFGSDPGTPRPWYGVLGEDAARLGAASLADFPMQQTREGAKVAELHRRARDELASVEVTLSSSEAHGFAGGRQLPRTFRVVDAGARR